MASPEVIDSSGTMDSGFNDDLSAPQGWTKKLMPKKAGTPKRKDVIYIAPDGEEIKNKKQLDKYLKVHPGGPSSADFDWSTGETPRRSARLSSKGRLSSDSTDTEPVTKRSRRSLEDTKEVRSPGTSTTPSRKGRKSQPLVDTAGKDEVMQEAEKDQDEGVTEGATAPSGDTEDNNPTDEGKKVDEDGIDDEAKAAVTGNDVKEANPTSEVQSASEPSDQLGSSEEPDSAAVKVNAEDQVLTAEGTSLPVVITDSVMKETPTLIEEEKVETTVLEVEDPLKFMAVDAVDEVTKLSEAETSLKQENLEVEETVDAPQNLDDKEVENPVVKNAPKDEDSVKPKDHVEPQGIHALIEEPVLCGVTKPDQTTESPISAAERVGVSI
ncbi:hypothetical protein MPTK1_2g13780 [Marchantia polymorpha subsp. ruderalis]